MPERIRGAVVLKVDENSRRMLLTADPTQAIKLGSTFRIERVGLIPWPRSLKLQGSYRMPKRICECIAPLAESISLRQKTRGARSRDLDTDTPIARRDAVIGCRPIVVAGTLVAVAASIATIARLFEPMLIDPARVDNAPELLILDRDPQLALKIHEAWGKRVTTLNIREAKGLERAGIVWSTRRGDAWADEAVEEAIYTSMTRSTGLLVIALAANPPEEAKGVLRKLRRDRLLFWDETAAKTFAQVVGGAQD